MIPRTKLSLTLASLTWVATAAAQTSFPEVEPNSQKTNATSVNGIVAGDSITGISTGTTTTLADTTSASADTFRVKTGPLPLGIYKHTLTLTTSGAVGHTGTIRGLNQTTGVIGTVDTTFQTSVATATPPRANHWYGFGKQEEVYYRVAGAAATTGAYTTTLSTTPVSPVVVGPTFAAGTLTITSIGQTSTDTEVFVFDANLDVIPGYHNDDEGPTGTTLQSRLIRTYTPGTYYVAVSDWNTATNLSDANPDEDTVSQPVLDFPNVICANDRETTAVDLDITISDGGTPVPVTLSAPGEFDILFVRFTVVGTNTPSTPFCDGSAVGTTCVACGNNGAAGRGCANSSFAAGGLLGNTGLASVSGDTLVLMGTDVTGPGLFFQSSALAASPIAFGDGMLCASVGILRLGVVFPTAGSASYPGGLTPNPVSVGGAPIAAGNTKHYQCWYRDAVTFCTASTFNLTNGISLAWTP